MSRDTFNAGRGAARGFRRRPLFATTAASIVALGIGANISVFLALRRILIDPLPYPDASALVRLLPVDHMRGLPFDPQDVDAIGRLPGFLSVAGCGAPDVLALRSHPAVLTVATGVTRQFFPVFGTAPQLGRVLFDNDFAPGARNAVLSFDAWKTIFKGDSDVLGRTVRLRRESWTVVGVMPPGFAPPCFDAASSEAWIPYTPTDSSAQFGLVVIARRAPGVTTEAAQAQIDSIMASRAVERGDTRYEHAWLEALGSSRASALAPGLIVIQGIALVLLAIACANLMNLFLVQTTNRYDDFAVRAALGASPARLARSVLGEAAAIATVGALVGVLLSWGGSTWLTSFSATVLPRGTLLAPRVSDLFLGLLAGAGAAMAFGSIPAWLASRVTVISPAGIASHASSSPFVRRARDLLVGLQMLLAVVLVVASAILARSAVKIMSVRTGFDAANVVTTELHLSNGPGRNTSLHEIAQRVENELAGAIDPSSIAFSDVPPFAGGSGRRWDLRLPGAPDYVPRSFQVKYVSRDYFSVLRMPLVRGRAFPSDVHGSSAVVVSAEFARQLGAGRDVIGGELRSRDATYEIAGVVGDVKTTWLTETDGPTLYVPLDASPATTLSIIVRPDRQERAIAALSHAIRRIDPAGPDVAVERLSTIVWRSEAVRRFYLVVVSMFGLLSGVVAGLGTYSASAWTTSLRAREMGIRLALGAAPSTLVSMVVRDGLRVVVIGLASGVLVAWWLGGLVEASPQVNALLFQVTTHDVGAALLATAGVLAVSFLACWLPARRIARMDPKSSLRSQ